MDIIYCTMPNVKNQFLRIKVINKCLRDFDNLYDWRALEDSCADELTKATNGQRVHITRKTIYNDIDYIKKNYNVEIITSKIGRNAYYRYASEDMTIDDQPLGPSELERFKEAVLTLSTISGRNEFDFIADLLPRLETSLNVELEKYPIISYQKNDELFNGHLVNELYQYIRNKTVLIIEYKTFKGELLKYELHPYFLKQYNNRWFLFGFDKESHEQGLYPINLAIDRINSINPTKKKYRKNDIDFIDYFEDIIGVTKYKNVKKEKIELRISPALFPYIRTKPLHPQQKTLKLGEDGCYYTSIQLRPNPEMYALFLGYGDGLAVMGPNNVVEEMKKKIKNMIENY